MRVLVTAASRHGATAEMADVIATILGEAGLQTVVVPPGEVTTLAGIDAVVVGSGIYLGRWLEPAKRFVDTFADELRQRPTWAFSSGPLGDPAKPEGTSPEVVAIVNQMDVREHRVFPGAIERDELGFAERLITRAVGALAGDFRPWPEIEEWAHAIATALVGLRPEVGTAGVR